MVVSDGDRGGVLGLGSWVLGLGSWVLGTVSGGVDRDDLV